MSLPSLPQHATDPTARFDALEAARKRYALSFEKYPFLAMSASLPKAENIDPAWTRMVTQIVIDVVKNDRRADQALGSPASWPQRMAELRLAVQGFVQGEPSEAINDLVALLVAGPIAGAASSLEDFKTLFRTIPAPDLANTFQEDAAFSRKFLSGSDPEILSRPAVLDPDFPLTDAQIAAVSPGDTVAAAFGQGRLFYADYGMLDALVPNDLGGARRYCYAPRVAFVVPPGGVLSVFAIQIGRTPGQDNPTFTPKDGWGWEIAKIHVSVADTIAGALWFHHARTHLVAEPMIVSAHRQLAADHPIFRLLSPHFAGTLYINSVGHDTVFAPHGILDWFTGATRDSIRDLALRSVRELHFDDTVFPRRLALRGVDDPAVLRDFPFRDDGLLVWEALRAWVGEYVGVYYGSDADVTGDTELQAWIREITAPDGAGIQGLGENGGFRTRTYLTDVLTQIIFSGSAVHAAMNFPVLSEMTFVPNSPFAAYAARPTRAEGWTEADWLAVLPPLDQAQRQLDVAWLLGASRFGSLGDYPGGHFEDPRVTGALARFRSALDRVEAAIDARNVERPPYIHLKPSRIPPSINI